MHKETTVNKMASGFTLPPPSALDIHDTNVTEKWKKFHLAWDNYSLATELNKKGENIQVATLLTIIGEDARNYTQRLTGMKKVTIRKSLQCYESLPNIVARISLSKDIVLIAKHKSQEKHTNSTEQR